jgi:para-aminobenzoate synthetase
MRSTGFETFHFLSNLFYCVRSALTHQLLNSARSSSCILRGTLALEPITAFVHRSTHTLHPEAEDSRILPYPMRKMRQTVHSLIFLVLFAVVRQTFAWVQPQQPLISRKAVPYSTTTRQLQWASPSLAGTSLAMTREDNVPIDVDNNKNNNNDNKLNLKLLLLDHYDSFTYNLADMLAQICTNPPIVLAADSARSWTELQEIYDLYDLDGIILSPGPGNPATDGKLAINIVEECPDVPILGVCLGHQILGHVYGATVDTAPVPIHGQVRPIVQIVHNNNDDEKEDGYEEDVLWKNIPKELLVTRYHSLAVQLKSLDDVASSPLLRPTAVSPEDGVLMAMQHTKLPHFGVQFHPESIGTVHGKQLIHNFCDICDEHSRSNPNPSRQQQRQARDAVSALAVDESPTTHTATTTAEQQQQQQPPFTVYMHKVESTSMRPDEVMQSFLADNTHTFWLDEAFSDGQSAAISILGASDQRVEYWGREKQKDCQGLFQWKRDATSKTAVPSVKKLDTDILTYLQDQHCHATDAVTLVEFGDDDHKTGNVQLNRLSEDELQDTLPFDYRGGHVGYLGYEVRHDTARYLEEQEHGQHHETSEGKDGLTKASSHPKIPTAAFLWAHRSFVYDHQGAEWYLVGVAPTDESPDSTIDWLRSTTNAMQEWRGLNGSTASTEEAAKKTQVAVPTFTPNRPRETYNRNFDECIEQIRLGESYELCLTNQLETNVKVPGSSPLELYNVLRRRNPAPFSAFLNWNSQSTIPTPEIGTDAAVALCCSSPERFISVKRKRKQLDSSAKDGAASFKLEVEAKPIKGTCARVMPANGRTRTPSEEAEDVERAQTLQSSLKNRAENLMIVDLLRNDMSRVCQTGSVHVAKLMDIESYATVHQMVSTIRGALDPTKASSIDVLKACFPGGSMTGAPKLRTMELIDAMEEGVSRGPYSGCLGYISLNGSMDMNIVIRTAVLTPADGHDAWNISIGAGGAITALSESTDEYEEMILKSSAVVGAVQEWACSSESTPENTAKNTFDSKVAVEGELLETKRV